MVEREGSANSKFIEN